MIDGRGRVVEEDEEQEQEEKITLFNQRQNKVESKPYVPVVLLLPLLLPL